MSRDPKAGAHRSVHRLDRSAEDWVRYRDNLARHLIGISRDLESRVLRALIEEGGHRGLRPSFGPFLSLIPDAGQPLSVIAEELAISPQACSQLARLLEDAGYLDRRTNPEDRRSKLVRLTRRGRRLVEQGIQLIIDCESEYELLLGATRCRGFASALAVLYAGFGLPTHTDPTLSARARGSVGVLPMIAVRVQRELMTLTTARGHSGLKMSHGQVLPLIGAGGGRIVEIARIQGVSRQAISTISLDLESLDYLRREPDRRDGRGIVLRLTARGKKLIRDSVSALDDLDASIREILGERRFGYLQSGARDLYQALHLEEEIFRSTTPDATRASIGDPEKRVRNGDELRDLASRLREQLGSGDAARLGVLLGPQTTRTTT
jgi:DNA-binding MarR family transcriptional regulator